MTLEHCAHTSVHLLQCLGRGEKIQREFNWKETFMEKDLCCSALGASPRLIFHSSAVHGVCRNIDRRNYYRGVQREVELESRWECPSDTTRRKTKYETTFFCIFEEDQKRGKLKSRKQTLHLKIPPSPSGFENLITGRLKRFTCVRYSLPF